MKKFVIFLVIVMIIVCTISYLYFNYVSYNQEIRNSNLEFEQYLNKELNGNDVGSIINKAIDYNEKNEIQKDDDGLYIENDENSIRVDIKMLDDDGTIYQMEKIYNGNINNFMKYYSLIKFKTVQVDYHKKTGKIKYILLEQVTQ